MTDEQRAAIANSLQPSTSGGAARFVLLARDESHAADLGRRLLADLAALGPAVSSFSALDHRLLLLEFAGRRLASTAAAFAASYALQDAFDVEAAEPDLETDLFPVSERRSERFGDESIFSDFPPWCWAPEQPELRNDPLWALRQIGVPDAWAYSRALKRAAGGKGVVIAQPDTGITRHPELEGLDRAAGYDFVDNDNDPTDPLNYSGNPGHGTGTASVAVAPGHLHVSGSAPAARLMPIRAIESVIRVSQVSVAQAIDFGVANGAQVVTMSLGGLPSISLERALRRAVAADVVVVAAAGNCVHEVVFPARYPDCIAVAGTNWKDEPWRGTCQGDAVTIAAPGENVFRAAATVTGADDYGQGQGTSFAVALVAGVAALWLAHHGRANLIAAARANGETLQAAFKRLLRATARRPANWDAFNMGAGIVDAPALLRAGFDAGRGQIEAVTVAHAREAGAGAKRGLMVSVFGEAGDVPGLDWNRYGQEMAWAALSSKLPPRPVFGVQPEAVAAAPALSPQLRKALAGTALAGTLTPPPPAPPPPAQEANGGGAAESSALGGPFRGLLARRISPVGRFAHEAASAEAPAGLLRPGAHPDDILGQVEDFLRRMPPDDVPDPDAFRRALTILLRESADPVRRYVNAPHLLPTPQDRRALEAVIRADGSRPSFLLRDGAVNPDHPLLGGWKDKVAATSDLVRERAKAIGAIDSTDPAKRRPYYGTGTLVRSEPAGKLLVLTNLHVLLALREDLGHLFLPGAGPNNFRLRPGVVVDFSRESNRLNKPAFAVVEATAPGIDGPGFARLDLAVLRIEPTAEQTLGEPVVVSSDLDVVQGARDFCIIGFPAAPDASAIGDTRVDWGWVTSTLFGHTFGVKRLAPGIKYRDLGSLPGDPRRWVFGHDATTLAGSSGSPVLDWTSGGGAVGIHFAGQTLETNVAHAVATCVQQLRGLGIAVDEGDE